MKSDFNIEELFRQQSRKQELQPSIQTWERIRYEMQRKKSKRKVAFYRLISAASVLLIVSASIAFVYLNDISKNNGTEVFTVEENEYWEEEQKKLNENQDGDLAVTNMELGQDELESAIAPETKEETEIKEFKSDNSQKLTPPPAPEVEIVSVIEEREIKDKRNQNTSVKEVKLPKVASAPMKSSSVKTAESLPSGNANAGLEKSSVYANKPIAEMDELELMESEDVSFDEVVTEGHNDSRKKHERKKRKENAPKHYKISKNEIEFFGGQVKYKLTDKNEELLVFETVNSNKYPKKVTIDLNQNMVTYSNDLETIESRTLKGMIQLNQSDLLMTVSDKIN